MIIITELQENNWQNIDLFFTRKDDYYGQYITRVSDI